MTEFKNECFETVKSIAKEIEQDVYGYLEEHELYNISYTCNQHKEYEGVQIMVACGGPNIYVDTNSKAVELYWGTTQTSYPLDTDTVNELDSYFEDLFNSI